MNPHAAAEGADGRFRGLARALVVLALVGGVLWTLRSLLPLLLLTVLLGVGLSGISRWLATRTGSPYVVALVVSVAAIAAMATAVTIRFGQQIWQQVSALWEQAPQALSRAEAALGVSISLEDILRSQSGGGSAALLTPFSQAGSALFDVASGLIVVVTGSIYLAADLDRYRRGVLALTPQRWRPQVGTVMGATAQAWRQWFAAQLINMALVGSLVGAGTALIGLPSPLALGLIAGLFEIVPLIGPILGGAPAVLVALAEGGNAIWWTLGLIVAVQQIEANLVSPLIQARMISLPPAIVLFAIVAGGVVMGPIGVLIAVPLAIFFHVVMIVFYVRDYLGEDADLPTTDEAA